MMQLINSLLSKINNKVLYAVNSQRKHNSTFSFSKVSSLLPPASTLSNQAQTAGNAAQLLEKYGVVQHCSPGLYALLPLGERALAKLTSVVCKEMEKCGAVRIELPTLTSQQLFEKTGRLDADGPELMTLTDRRNHKYVLSPTYEESVCSLVSRMVLGYHNLPFKLYQVTHKYRDEYRPRRTLFRSKQFLMKDLYTFDKDDASATSSYNAVTVAYNNIFDKIGLPYVRASGTCGSIGGQYSHEYHYLSPAGDDTLLQCKSCDTAVTAALMEETGQPHNCANCGTALTPTTGMEVGHTFLLGTKYSSPLKAEFMNHEGKRQPLVMGCYGLGLSRVLVAAMEAASVAAPQQDANSLLWPWAIAPYRVCIIGPKRGSKESAAASWVEATASALAQQVPAVEQEIIIDDRDRLTIGARVREARMMGYPFIVVIGKHSLQSLPKLEFIDNTAGMRQMISSMTGTNANMDPPPNGGVFLTQLELLHAIEKSCSYFQKYQ